MTKIITHDGRGHQDDFLATAVCIYKLNCAAFRQSFLKEDLEDENTWVLDQGRCFDENFHNFDHHQIEKEICAFTMVLDYFYKNDYRVLMPQLKFIEIFDSYGPKKAAEFLEIKEESLDCISSPIYLAMIKSFSRIQGEIKEPMYSIMKDIGKEICDQIENSTQLLEILEQSSFFEFNAIKILDTTKCNVGTYKHDQLPTKIYSKLKKIEPEVILTIDNRQNGYRMVSINTDSLKFLPNEKSYFTHNSGFLTGFKNYEDYSYILLNFISRK